MKIRCRNCGLWHNTRDCPRHGPMFPAPGKTAADYVDVAREIANRVARDIVAEHEGTEAEEGEEVRVVKKRRPRKAVVQGAGPVPEAGHSDPHGELQESAGP
jgi:hypothetical protein